MKIDIDWILTFTLPLFFYIISISFVRFLIKDGIKSYFFDGSLKVEKESQLPNNRTRNKMNLVSSILYGLKSVIAVAFFLIISANREEAKSYFPTHFFDVLIITFIVISFSSFSIYQEYFDQFREDYKRKLNK